MSTPSNEPHNPYSQGGPSYDGASFNQPPQFHGHTPGGTQQPEPLDADRQFRGGQLSQTAMILGVLSVVISILGFILGPIAIVTARRAERDFTTAATVGKVTGWIGTALGILWLVLIGVGLAAGYFFRTG